jgi:hypothetical protein
MNHGVLLHFFIWTTLINYGILILWFAILLLAGKGLYKIHSRWFPISEERFYGYMYQGMMIYKLGIMLFSLVPLIVLHIVTI